ncbi:MAG: hypothetical protein [Caudoviricetes sp.]|nr:MAG: hypothetical protein [Caudoviricetes sp.]
MNYTFTPHTGDGNTKVFSFSLAGQDTGYVQRSDINVFVGGVAVPFTLSLQTPNQVTITTAPPVGAEILIRRIVPKTNTYTDFQSGNPFTADNLNKSFLQGLYLQQEWLDGFLPVGFYLKQNVDVGGHKFTNMAEGTVSGDSVNYDQWYDHELRIEGLEGDLTGITSRTIPYYYIATGGETRWSPAGRTFDSAIVFINGVFQNQNLGAFSITNNGFNFAEPLVKGDEVYALIGSTPATGFMVDDQDVSVVQPFAGSVVRSQHDKNSETVSATDFGASPSASPSVNASAFTNAANAVGEGGTVLVPSGEYQLYTITVKPVNFLGDGQGSTVLSFNNTSSDSDGIVFSAPTKAEIEFGCSHLSIRARLQHGRHAIYTPRGTGLNGLRPKPTFRHLSFYSDNTGDSIEGFSQTLSWKFMFNAGDSWQFTIERIDAVGSYKARLEASTQFLDGFIRTSPAEGILSMRMSNVTTHNIANFFEIQQKTYFALNSVDVSRAWQGVYDADDRVLETNRAAYGESIWYNVGINAQYRPIHLDSRFLLIINGGFVHRAGNGYDHGMEWVGIHLSRARACTIQGMEVGTGRGYTGHKVGIRLDAGDANNISNLAIGLMDVGIQVGVTGSAYGANQASHINNVSTVSEMGTVLNLQSCRNLQFSGYSGSSLYTVDQFLVNDDKANNTQVITGVNSSHIYTDNSIYLYNKDAPTDQKRIRVDTSSGMSWSTQTDNGGLGNNFLIAARSGTLIDRVELRTRATSGGYILLNAPEVQVSGATFKPVTANTTLCGTAPSPWAGGNTQVAFTVTSDMTKKNDITPISELDNLLDAWGNVDWYRYKLNSQGEGGEYHFGVMAQEVLAVFKTAGLDATEYGIVQYDSWDDIYDADGELTTPSGELYSVNYGEAQALEAAYQRREISRLKLNKEG